MNMLFALLHKARVVVLSMSQVWYPAAGDHVNPETPSDTYDRRTIIADTAMKSAMRGNPKGFEQEEQEAQISKFHPIDALALILTIERSESGLDYFVHAGEESHLGTQDSGRARCLGQVQTWEGNTLLTKEEHESLSGVDYDSTLRCANAIHEYLWYHAVRCRVRVKGRRFSKWVNHHRMSDYEAQRLMAYYAKGTCTPRFASKAERQNLSKRSALFREIRTALEAKDLPEMPERPVDTKRVASTL